MADESLNFRAFGEDVSAGRMFGDLADKADDAKNHIHDLGGESKTLDERLEETRAHLRGLIDDFHKTGDTSLFRDIRKDRSTISMLESLREDVEQSLLAAFRSPAIVGGIGAAAAVLAAPVGAAIGGAVLGGVGLGGIVGGIVAASSDPRVKAAGGELGAHLTSGLKDAGKPFIGPLLAEMGTLRRAGDEFTDELHDGFEKLAPLVSPLAHGIEGLVDELGPGLSDAFSAAQPAIRALANELPEVGSALSDMLTAIADESDGGVEGLLSLLHATEFLTRATGDLIGQFEWEYKGLVDIGAKLDEFKDSPLGILTANLGIGFNYLTDQATDLKKGLGDATSANHDFYQTMLDTNRAMEDGSQAAKDLKSAFDDLFGKQMSLDEAQLNYQKTLDDTLVVLKDGKRTLDENTAAGQENVGAVLDMIGRIRDLRQANIDGGMAIGDANKQYDAQLGKLRDTLIKLGFNKTAVDDLIAAYKKIPAQAETKVSAPGLASAYAKLLAYVELLGEAEGHKKFEFSQYRAGERNPSGRASGGPVMAGTTYWVGENGPELVTFGADGYVHNAADTRAMLSGASGGAAMAVEGRMVLDVTGADQAWKSLFVQMLRTDAGFRATVKQYVGA